MRKFGFATLVAAASMIGGVAFAADGEGGDAAAGKTVFIKCSLCHYAEKDKIKIGPSLYGVVGRQPGTLAAYSDKYSDAMKDFGKKNAAWTPALLFTYLEHPQQVVVGTKMAFAGLSSADDRNNVIAYLQTLK